MTITLGLPEDKQSSVHEILTALATKYGSTDITQVTTVQREYTGILKQAKRGGVNPKHWFTD